MALLMLARRYIYPVTVLAVLLPLGANSDDAPERNKNKKHLRRAQQRHCDDEEKRLTFEPTDTTFPLKDHWNGKSFPCYRESKELWSDPRGMYYVKIPKTDTHYWSSIGERIIAKVEQQRGERCSCYGGHGTGSELNLINRITNESFVYTFIRDPREYVIMKYLFRQSKKGQGASISSMLTYIGRNQSTNSQAKYLAMSEWNSYRKDDPTLAAKRIIREYDFIGLTDDPDKSLVLLRLLLNLDAKDVLYNPSPNAGTKSFFRDKSNMCRSVLKDPTPTVVKEYLQSGAWYRDNAVEVELYEEVRKSIEATIDRVGRDRFDRALCEHKFLMEQIPEACAHVRYPCNEDGAIFYKTCTKEGCDKDCVQQIHF